MKTKTISAVIVAAGRGTRAGGEIPKQWRCIAGEMVITHTLRRFQSHPQITEIIVVLHPDYMDHEIPVTGIRRVTGGAERSASVQAGLAQAQGTDFVLIHDVARPCVSHNIISDVIAALATTPAAAPALPVTDALWTGANGKVTGMQARDGLFRAQTPQGFQGPAIREAHAMFQGHAADDVEVARAAGLDVAIVPGEEDNLKVTYPADFDRAARILERS